MAAACDWAATRQAMIADWLAQAAATGAHIWGSAPIAVGEWDIGLDILQATVEAAVLDARRRGVKRLQMEITDAPE